MPSYSIYLHIPFCVHRCAYCDFNTYAGLGAVIPYYVDALCREIQLCGESAGEKLVVHTVFLGGGSPSPGNLFVPADLLKPLLEDAVERGRASAPARPWLGVNAEEMRGRLFVTRVSPGGPADRAGVRPGDMLTGVGADEVTTLADFYRKVGPAAMSA